MYFDRFDICEAYYCFFCDYHSGQSSEMYQRMCRMTKYFKPRRNLSTNTLSDNARQIYKKLTTTL